MIPFLREALPVVWRVLCRRPWLLCAPLCVLAWLHGRLPGYIAEAEAELTAGKE